MESVPIYSEKSVPAKIKLPLYRKDDYFCLLSRRKWSVLSEELVAEVKKICKEHKFK